MGRALTESIWPEGIEGIWSGCIIVRHSCGDPSAVQGSSVVPFGGIHSNDQAPVDLPVKSLQGCCYEVTIQTVRNSGAVPRKQTLTGFVWEASQKEFDRPQHLTFIPTS